MNEITESIPKIMGWLNGPNGGFVGLIIGNIYQFYANRKKDEDLREARKEIAKINNEHTEWLKKPSRYQSSNWKKRGWKDWPLNRLGCKA